MAETDIDDPVPGLPGLGDDDALFPFPSTETFTAIAGPKSAQGVEIEDPATNGGDDDNANDLHTAIHETVEPTTGDAETPEVWQQGETDEKSSAKTAFIARRLRKSFQRRTVDFNSSVIRMLEARRVKPTRYAQPLPLMPNKHWIINLLPPVCYSSRPVNAACTRLVHVSMNKFRSYVNVVRWTPEGRRLITGSANGEFTLWNGLTFNFETILQAHDAAVRVMKWAKNDTWLLSGDSLGVVKYWQTNMNNLKVIQAHKETVRGLALSPTGSKFATGSDDCTIKIWDFNEGEEERTCTGHGWDVKCLDWHPTKGMIASGSRDSSVKLWDPRTGQCLTTFVGHKNPVNCCGWNLSGNWLATGSKDSTIKLWDIRVMREISALRGHPKEVNSIAWHPVHETLLASGGSDGSLLYWVINGDGENPEPAGSVPRAHDSIIWAIDWHPMGHLLATGSNDHATRFWTRNRPGDMLTEGVSREVVPEEAEDEFIPGVTDMDENAMRMFEMFHRRMERGDLEHVGFPHYPPQTGQEVRTRHGLDGRDHRLRNTKGRSGKGQGYREFESRVPSHQKAQSGFQYVDHSRYDTAAAQRGGVSEHLDGSAGGGRGGGRSHRAGSRKKAMTSWSQVTRESPRGGSWSGGGASDWTFRELEQPTQPNDHYHQPGLHPKARFGGRYSLPRVRPGTGG